MNNTLNKNLKTTLTIAIIDDDNFYITGLAMALTLYFNKKNITINFIFGYHLTEPVDIVFQAIRSGTCIAPCRQHHAMNDKPHYFAIADTRDFHLQHLYRDIKKNIFYRHQSVSELFQLIERNVFLQQELPEKIRASQAVFLREPLTSREHEVLCHLKQGKTPADTANDMGINVKTISAHKRAAMKKLNFRRTNELFHWMLKGGLSQL